MIKVINPNDTIETNNVGTHNGIFHADEVVATAIIDIYNGQDETTKVIRSRDLDLLNSKTYLIYDIGGGSFDHHQKGGNGTRPNGIDYASAGLLWNYLGNEIINKLKPELNDNYKNLIFQEIDDEIIQKVDAEDNGQLNEKHTFSFITSFLPIWDEKEKDYDKNFEECANIVSKTLGSIIKTKIAYYYAKNEIHNRINSDDCLIDNILLLPSQTIPWTDIMIDINETADKPIDFVAFPYPAGGYAIQCVPPSKYDKFGQRIPFPEKWAGETSNLPEISKIESAILCHRGRFFARANEFEDIIEMGRKATKEFKNNNKLVKKMEN